MIDRKDVEHVARLTRLALTEPELERMREQLNSILAHLDTLRAVPTEGVEPTSHAVDVVNVMREDEPAPCLPRDVALANAPDPSDGLFRVPRIIEE
ncbi:MAG: Asp-tRNA(Asn)/Glu-tRNA(Gln) amidotransferase GatCAB subunit C [Candidatus Rokuibacteriota bacterium]|nr:MAG: Asp-tRNA(Asn)/Glu-tRNA(Gln) amidotransferase GatCAB subunit C [Candidatus Rokubacteria bacterium]